VLLFGKRKKHASGRKTGQCTMGREAQDLLQEKTGESGGGFPFRQNKKRYILEKKRTSSLQKRDGLSWYNFPIGGPSFPPWERKKRISLS